MKVLVSFQWMWCCGIQRILLFWTQGFLWLFCTSVAVAAQTFQHPATQQKKRPPWHTRAKHWWDLRGVGGGIEPRSEHKKWIKHIVFRTLGYWNGDPSLEKRERISNVHRGPNFRKDSVFPTFVVDPSLEKNLLSNNESGIRFWKRERQFKLHRGTNFGKDALVSKIGSPMDLGKTLSFQKLDPWWISEKRSLFQSWVPDECWKNVSFKIGCSLHYFCCWIKNPRFFFFC